jgi:hypothetical protein
MFSRAGSSRALRGASLLVVGLFLMALVPSAAGAQAVTGTLLGTVTDSTGAVVTGAKVTVTNQNTGFTRSVTTDAAGEYTTPSIPTGVYTVLVEMDGFKATALSQIAVGVDQRVRIDATLEVGAMTESVTIEATTPLVQTSSSELGTTVTQEQIEALPLNGRNFVSLTRTVPGVLRGNPGSNIDGAGSLAWRASASFSANGQRARDNNYMLDGVDNNETWLQTVVIFPSVDSLEEVKLQTSTYSAEFGRSLGGVVNLQIKSGTNTYRGSVFEFHRNDALDANNFFNNRAVPARPKPDFEQNQFGGTLGGPIFRDRTFFFGDYQGHREKQGQTFVSTVPSSLMRAGNFSEVNRVIYDPLTGQPFQGNIIPVDRIDPIARNIIDQLYPEPNAAGRRGTTGQVVDNYVINPIKNREDNQFNVKVDHNLTTNNRFFTRYSYEKTYRFQPATIPHGDAGATFGAGDGNIDAQGLAFNDTHTFGSNWLNEFRFGWSSVKFNMTSIDYGENYAERVGIPNVNLNEVTSAMSQITFQNIRNLGANGNQPLITNQNDFQLFNNVTWIKGRHTLKLGGSVTLRSREILNADQIVGQFGFNNNQTSNCAGRPQPCALNSGTGFDVASFMLGHASAVNRRLFDAGTYTEKRPEYSLYLQDDWRATSKLTLNVGLRWDVYPPWREIEDRQSNFDVSTGRFVVASDDAVIEGVKVGRYLQTYSKGDVGPRLGFAYDVAGDGKTLVRGGWGVFWNFTPGGTSSSKAQNPPFLQATALTPTPTATGINLGLRSMPPPPGVNPAAPAAGATRSIFDINFRDGYAHNFNLNVQRQLGTNYMVEVAYAGSKGRQMMAKVNPNQAPAVLGVTDSNVNRPMASLAPALRNIGQAASIGYVDYNGLLVKFQRRFANNFSFLNAYTWGKAIDINSDNDGDVSFQNVYDIERQNRGPADYDVTHTLSSSWIYELPIAREQWYGGWQINGILLLRTGLPFTVTQNQGVLSTGTGNRPNRICSGKLDNPTIDRWFDASCFVSPTELTATYGDSGRNILRGPGQFNIDMSLIKRTRIGRLDTELRVEAFNVLNHPQFAPRPNSNINSAAVGTITSLLPNPSCALCGTTERQIQLGVKVRF